MGEINFDNIKKQSISLAPMCFEEKKNLNKSVRKKISIFFLQRRSKSFNSDFFF